MFAPQIKEIQSSLDNKDYDLALRRILDASQDLADEAIVRKSMAISQEFEHNKELDLNAALEPLLVKMSQGLANLTVDQKLLLEAKKISKTYSKGQFSLKPIDVSLSSGQIIGVVGENGNGKTTLLECLSGLLSIDQGTIDFPESSHKDAYDRRHQLAFIPQRIPRWYGLLKDNLHFSASISKVYNQENELLVDFILERLKLRKYENLTWNQISSGYRTRFEIARVLLQRPKVLVLDEPLANLDIKAQETILTDLRFLSQSRRNPMGIVLSSQQLHEVEKVADSVLMIKDGRCIFSSATDELKGTVVELESNMDRQSLLDFFTSNNMKAHYNGGFYTIESKSQEAKEILEFLVRENIPIQYFRDISKSSKRYFN